MESTVQVVTVAAVVPKLMMLDPCVDPKDVPIPGMTVKVLPAIPAAGLTHAICTSGAEETVSAMLVVASRVPEDVPVDVPWMLIVTVPTVAELVAMSDSTLELVVGLTLHEAVTPDGIPDAVRVTAPVNPPTSVTLMVSVPPAFRPIVNAAAVGAIVKLPVPEEGDTVIVMVMDLLVVPEVAVTVTVKVPVVAVLLAVNVNTLVVLVGLVPIARVTPLGRPDADRVTGLVAPVTVMVQVALPLCRIGNPLPQDDESEKPAVTVRIIVVVLVRLPEVPVIVTVDVPIVAVALAVNVITEVVVAGLAENAAVTPLGRPEAESVTLPANGLTSAIVIVTVQLPPWGSVHVVGADAIVKLPVDGTTVSVMVVLAVVEPEVPVTVTVYVPAVAVALAVNVSTLVVVVGLVPYATVTPVGRPAAARVTLPVNPPTSVTVMVSVAVLA
jgi:hypothetical protein